MSLTRDAVQRDARDPSIGATPCVVDDRRAIATGIDGTLPGPLIRLKQGLRGVLNAANALDEDSSIAAVILIRRSIPC